MFISTYVGVCPVGLVPPGFEPIGTPVKVSNNIISGNDIPMITELGT